MIEETFYPHSFCSHVLRERKQSGLIVHHSVLPSFGLGTRLDCLCSHRGIVSTIKVALLGRKPAKGICNPTPHSERDGDEEVGMLPGVSQIPDGFPDCAVQLPASLVITAGNSLIISTLKDVEQSGKYRRHPGAPLPQTEPEIHTGAILGLLEGHPWPETCPFS